METELPITRPENEPVAVVPGNSEPPPAREDPQVESDWRIETLQSPDAHPNDIDDAFSKIVEEFSPFMRSIAYSKTQSPHDTDDVIQESFKKAFAAIRDGKYKHHSLKGWLCAITRNAATDHIRRQGKIPLPTDDEQALESALPFGSAYLSPERSLDLRMEEENVVSLLGRIANQDLQAVIELWLEDRQYKEIAELLGLKIGTVKSRVHRAREALGIIWDQDQETAEHV